MALLSKQTPTTAGVAVTYAAAAAGGDTFANSGKEFVHVKNGSGSPITVTITSPNPCSYNVTNAAHNLTITVPATSDRSIGPFDKDRFNATDGTVAIGYSAVTTVTVAILASA